MNKNDRREADDKPLTLLVTDDDRWTDDDLLGDPLIERHAGRRREKQTNRLLDILDSLERTGK